MTSSLPTLLRSTLVAALLAGAAAATPVHAEPAHPIRTAKPADDVLRRELTPMQYEVTQHAATEAPFTPGYFDNHAAGLYVDITTGQPLFSSTDKFDSGTGWPSFFRTIAPGVIVEKRDTTHGTVRTEVRSAVGDAHLGHVFTDGPKPTGLRYCINSAALRFIPVDRLAAEGYGAYRPLFVTPVR